MYNRLPEEPLGMLDIAGLAFRFWRSNMGSIVRFLMAPSILSAIVGTSFTWLMGQLVHMSNGGKDWGAALGLGLALFIDYLIWMGVFWWLFIRLLALIRLSLGFSATLDEARRFTTQRKWALLGVYVISLFATLGLTVFWCLFMVAGFVVPDPLRALTGGMTMLFGSCGIAITVIAYMLVLYFSFAVLACENISMFEVLGKTCQLVFKNFFRALLFGCLFMIIMMVVGVPLSLPIGIITLIDYFQHGVFSGGQNASNYVQPFYVMVFTQAWEGLVGLILKPLPLLAWGYFYYDIRMRNEGLDIKRKLAAVDSERRGAGDQHSWNPGT